MRRALAVAVVLAALLTTQSAALAEAITFTASGSFQCNAVTCSYSGTYSGGTLSQDDTYACGTGITVTMVGDVDSTGAGGLNLGSGCTLVASAATQARGLRISTTAEGLDAVTGSTVRMQGAWLPPYTNANPLVPQATRPTSPWMIGNRVEMCPSGDCSLARIWYYSGDTNATSQAGAYRFDEHDTRAATEGNTYLTDWLADIQDRQEAGQEVLIETHPYDPTKSPGADPWQRYRVTHVECNQTADGDCSRANAAWVATGGGAVASDDDADGDSEVGFLEVSLRQFIENYVGAQASFQDTIATTIASDVTAGARCVRLTNTALSVGTAGGVDQRPAVNQRVGWWITFEKASTLDPGHGSSYAIGKTLDETAGINTTGTDVVCLLDAGGVREAHAAADATENAVWIHRGLLPGDEIHAMLPVVIVRDAGAAISSAAVRIYGDFTLDAVELRQQDYVVLNNATAGQGVGADASMVATNLTYHGCESSGGATDDQDSCVTLHAGNATYGSAAGRDIDISGMNAVGGGTCADTTPPVCAAVGGDGDVHFVEAINAQTVTLDRSAIRYARDDSWFLPPETDADGNHASQRIVAHWIESSDAAGLATLGAVSGNMIDPSLSSGVTGVSLTYDARGVVCAACTSRDGAAAIAENVASGLPGSGSVREMGLIGNPSGYQEALGSAVAFRSSLHLMGFMPDSGGIARLIPKHANGHALIEWGTPIATPASTASLVGGTSTATQGASGQRIYLRDVWTAASGKLYAPSTGLFSDVAIVNLASGQALEVGGGMDQTGTGPFGYERVTIAHTPDFGAARWGDGVTGLFLGTPGAITNAIRIQDPGTRESSLVVRRVLYALTDAGSDAINVAAGADVRGITWGTGGQCFYSWDTANYTTTPGWDIGAGTTTIAAELLADGAVITADRAPDFVDPRRGYVYAPSYQAQHDCGARPAGVCEPTYVSRRFDADWTDWCSAGGTVASGGGGGGGGVLYPNVLSPGVSP